MQIGHPLVGPLTNAFLGLAILSTLVGVLAHHAFLYRGRVPVFVRDLAVALSIPIVGLTALSLWWHATPPHTSAFWYSLALVALPLVVASITLWRSGTFDPPGIVSLTVMLWPPVSVTAVIIVAVLARLVRAVGPLIFDGITVGIPIWRVRLGTVAIAVLLGTIVAARRIARSDPFERRRTDGPEDAIR